ncbi:MAG TPA: response regulator transcription factor [Aggregatilineales bacterium]|nr:response regulator transcription factor [Aggregatilineales bacterium]
MSIRIVVADDHPVVREGLVAMLGTQPDFEVIAEAGTGLDIVRQVVTLSPDVALMDLEMPQMDGVEAIRHIHMQSPKTQVIVLTAFDTDERIVGALKAGAQGYLLKGAPRSEIFNAIRVVSAGGSLIQPVVASKLLRHMAAQEDQPAGEALTEREMDVLRLLAQGKVNKEIAATLMIAERTVKFHVSSIMEKLGAGNRTEAVAIAAQRGLIEMK